MSFPRVLIIALARINANDTANNGLLLRNLFQGWPQESLAQIYSSGNTGDAGFFGRYFQLGKSERKLGALFYLLKAAEDGPAREPEQAASPVTREHTLAIRARAALKRLLIDTGIYELFFPPKMSRELRSWIEDFRPDIVFVQGYNLTFARLPLLVQQVTNAKLAFLTTDDWPTYLYSGQLGEPTLFRWLVRPVVRSTTRRLLEAIDVPFAFGQPMADEFARRYGKSFITLNHADDPQRFEVAEPLPVASAEQTTIIAIGYYNRYRWPLLLDVEEACRILERQGVRVRLVVLTSGIEPEGTKALAGAEHVEIMPDPGNDRLPGFLKSADILLLPEGFDSGFVSAIKLSISSKAHLYMFSHRPVLVYAHSDTGVARYATSSGWGMVVSQRSPRLLAEAISALRNGSDKARQLVARADQVAAKSHTFEANRDELLHGLERSIQTTEG